MANPLLPTDERLVLSTGARDSAIADAPSSLALLGNRVDKLLCKPHLLSYKKELVVTGGWHFSTDTMEALQSMYSQMDLEDAVDTEADEPMRSGDLTRARSQSSAAQKATPEKHDIEWSLAINLIKSILAKIEGLNSLEWETDLPFFKDIWAVIPENIENLSINVFVPDPQDRHEYAPHPEYFTKDDLTYLKNFKNLKRLRVYNMPESFQSVIWETVWKNANLDTLELGMRYNPITRDPDNGNNPMPAIDHSWKYNPEREMAQKYRGYEGSGNLHHTHGYGEYLDGVAISKARNVAMESMGLSMDDLKAMPLTTLRLDGFVVDDTSFAKYFDGLQKIVFTHKCVDAGLVLPKSLQGKTVIYKRESSVSELVVGSEIEVEAEVMGKASA
ncbi:uncharacterized protein BKCO1_2800070 [Diplodia corticola]|uniref:Uncharacterized protein n=1 Tax=Diplodia corticola TaxID=236234 RepID=A0A1J9QZ30_9PEZI|nr:uncharacterized protein BKCO1_2800070 [Diplodia corticola]OJD33656.1 hypothetical protein BKCO1_2800070 [Diplodia corticola]